MMWVRSSRICFCEWWCRVFFLIDKSPSMFPFICIVFTGSTWFYRRSTRSYPERMCPSRTYRSLQSLTAVVSWYTLSVICHVSFVIRRVGSALPTETQGRLRLLWTPSLRRWLRWFLYWACLLFQTIKIWHPSTLKVLHPAYCIIIQPFLSILQSFGRCLWIISSYPYQLCEEVSSLISDIGICPFRLRGWVCCRFDWFTCWSGKSHHISIALCCSQGTPCIGITTNSLFSLGRSILSFGCWVYGSVQICDVGWSSSRQIPLSIVNECIWISFYQRHSRSVIGRHCTAIFGCNLAIDTLPQ